jgi:hypothetical protein
VGDATDEAMDAVLAMTPGERRRELEGAGLDVARFHAEADAHWDPRPKKIEPLRPRRVRRVVAVSAIAAIAAGVVVVCGARSAPGPGVVASAPREGAVAMLRKEARDDCGAQRWEACLVKLDEARDLDRRGDESPDVRSMRKSAAEAVGAPRPRLP